MRSGLKDEIDEIRVERIRSRPKGQKIEIIRVSLRLTKNIYILHLRPL